MAILIEQVNECLSEWSVTLVDLVEFDEGGSPRMRGNLEINETVEELILSILKMLKGQDQAIRLIAAASHTSIISDKA